jgi:PKD repeat protein
MKRLTLAFLLVACLSASAALAENVIKVNRELGSSFVGYAPDRCIVIFKEGASPNSGQKPLSAIHSKHQVSHFDQQFPMAEKAGFAHPTDRVLTKYYKAKFPEGQLDEVMAAYGKLPFVERVEPVGMYLVSATPNDRYYDDPPPEFPYDQWHYWDSYGIEADMAWDLETGDPDVVCAVIDGGVRYYHYDLGGTNPPGPDDNSTNGNIWVNDGEIPGNGVDDDNNGYVDDVIGYDFVDDGFQCIDTDCGTVDNDPSDHGGHGTHVAGTIAAITNNDPTFGVAGVAGGWNDGTTNYTANGVKIMCLRAGFTSRRGGVMYMDMVSEALYYIATMVDKGVNVTAVNCSWGSSSLIAAAVDAVIARDVMVIVACGNANNTTADYLGAREDCLDVGATAQNGDAASFSTYGSWVDIAAPGVEILSTYHNSDDPSGDYIALMDGTSMSCPHVVGVAGLLESYDPTLTSQDKWDLMMNNTKPYNQTKYVGVGIVDARAALDAVGGGCDVTADFSGSPTTGCAPLTVNFTDQSSGPVISWDWDFGDGTGTSTAQNPSYQYNSPGSYTVTLTVTSATCSDDEVKTGYVTVQTVPVADFSGSPTSGYAPLTVDFTDLSTGSPDTWSWDFGDGVGTSAAQNPSYTYDNAGTYTVTLTASNACGSDGETKTGYIMVDDTPEMYMHVSAISVTRTGNNQKRGVAEVTVVDQYDVAVGGAVVYGYFNAPNTNTKTGTTLSNGVATISSDRTKTYPSDWCFTVTNIVLAGYTFDEAANAVTEACESGPVYSVASKDIVALPAGFSLDNRPNPFNPTTMITFTLPTATNVRLDIYNIVGQNVETLVEDYFEAGQYSVNWDGSMAASGIYLYRLTTDEFSTAKKMVLMK